VPCLSRIDPEAEAADRWRWTPLGLAETIEKADLVGTVEAFGNSFVAAAFMLGVAIEEVPAKWRTLNDSAFPVTACAVVENR
jgi:hypothetical protein